MVMGVLLLGCTGNGDATPTDTPDASETGAEAASSGLPFDGVIAYSATTADGEDTGEVVVALPDGSELYRVGGQDTTALAAPTGFPDRAWLVAADEDGLLSIGLLDATAAGVQGLDLPIGAWEIPRPGTARVVGQYAALVIPGEAVALVDVAQASATLLDVVPEPTIATLSPNGATLLVAGPSGGVLIDTADPTRALPLDDARPVEWLEDGAKLLVDGPPGAGVMNLADGSITGIGAEDVVGAVASSEDVVLVEVDGALSVTDLDGTEPTPLGEVAGGGIIVDPGGTAVVIQTEDGLAWVPLDGSGPQLIGEADLEVVAWPGPSGPRVAWFGVPDGRGSPLVIVDLTNGEATTLSPSEDSGEWAAFDLSSLDLSPDWRTGLIALRNGQQADLVHLGIDRPVGLARSGFGAVGSLSPDASLVVASTPDADGRPVVAIGGSGGSLVVEVGTGHSPVWLPVQP